MQGSSVLLYVYSIGPSNTIGHKLWLPNYVRLGGWNTWGFLNSEATGISKAILGNEKTLHVLRWRLLLELETHWTWVNLRTHMFMYFLPWILVCSFLIPGDGGWVGINFFLGAWLLDSWPSFTCTCSYTDVQLMPIFLWCTWPCHMLHPLWSTVMLDRCATTCGSTHYLPTLTLFN